MKKQLKEILAAVVQWLEGRSLHGIPGGYAIYARRVSWLHDRRGNQMCVRADCDFCGYQTRFPFAVSKIDRHLRFDGCVSRYRSSLGERR